MDNAEVTTREVEFIDAQYRLVEALTRLRLAQQAHARMFGKDAYQAAVDQLNAAFKPPPILDEA